MAQAVGIAGGIIFQRVRLLWKKEFKSGDFQGKQALKHILNAPVFRLTLLLVFTWNVQGKEWPVSSAQDVSEVLPKLKPGDEVVMKQGRWHDQQIRFTAKGTLQNPIVLKAQEPGKTRLTGYSFLKIYGSHLVIDGLLFTDGYIDSSRSVIRLGEDTRHCRLTNTAIIDYAPPNKKAKSAWVHILGLHNRVDHCYFSGKSNLGVVLSINFTVNQPNYHRIEHNYFGPRPYHGVNGAEIIRIGDSTQSHQVSRTTVAHNLFEGCSGEAEIITNKSCENYFRSNTFRKCQGALTLRHGNRSVVEGNFFLGEGEKNTGGVRVIGEGHRIWNNYFGGLTGSGARAALSIHNGIPDSPVGLYHQVKDLEVIHNTFVNNYQTVLVGYAKGKHGAILPPVGTVFANNIISGKKSPLIQLDEGGARIKYEGNIVYGVKTGVSSREGLQVVDPKLTKDKTGIYRPQKDSPAKGTATGVYPEITHDVDGQKRPGQNDVGADQISTKPILNKPLSRKDVGPVWRR